MINVDLINKLKGQTSQRDLAKAAGISFASVQRAQKGKAGLNVLRALAKYFGISVTALIKDNGD